MCAGPTVRGRPVHRHSAPAARLFSRRCRLGKGVLGPAAGCSQGESPVPSEWRNRIDIESVPGGGGENQRAESDVDHHRSWSHPSKQCRNPCNECENGEGAHHSRRTGLENVVQAGELDIAWDEQPSPNQWAHTDKNDTKLVSNGLLGMPAHAGSL